MILGAVLAVLIGKLCKNQRRQKLGYMVLFSVYGVGNLYFTLLSRITLPFVELESKNCSLADGAVPARKSCCGFRRISTHRCDQYRCRCGTANRGSACSGLGFQLVFLYGKRLDFQRSLPCVFPKLRNHWRVLLLSGAGISLAIETMQLLFNLGMFDLRDIVCNTFGTMLGAALYRWCIAPTQAMAQKRCQQK